MNNVNKAYMNLKKAIIIGATSGIGKALAEILLENNFKLGLTGRKKEILEEVRRGNVENVDIAILDCIRDDNSKVLSELTKKIGGLDLLILSTGIGNLNKDLGFKVENEANKLNVLAFTEIANWGYNYFDEQGYGHFVAITSVAGLFGYRKAPAYHAAKAYQINYLDGLRQKAFKSGKSINITDIRPGFVDTEMLKNKSAFWVISKEKAAKQIFSAINKRKDVGYTPRRWRFVAFIINFIPIMILKRIL
ncbi:oxidoreductase [Muriicola marianensis]|uniref:Oxidoreductase n=2 Tax=Muriicola marianensis TaxID=1324801 RepID=A0ABQ1QRR0_9FLAO|nr:oxidoreductase [Muriicola marianensis]